MTRKDRKTIEAIRLWQRRFEEADIRLGWESHELRARVKAGADIRDVLPEAYALAMEAVRRACGVRLYDEQLLCALRMAEGKIAEMKTGEGKTYAGILPAYLFALEGRGVFMMTANEYLAGRDREIADPVFSELAMITSCIRTDMDPFSKKLAYRAAVIYGTYSEFGFDYLRDNMAKDPAVCVQKGLCCAVLDEADSALIDEAKTPLIISGPSEGGCEIYRRAARFVKTLDPSDYECDKKLNCAVFTDAGIQKCEEAFKTENIASPENTVLYHALTRALHAQTMMEEGRDYIIEDGEAVIIDAFTGRKMPGRRFSAGLHQAVEAKEGLEVKSEAKTHASITFQNFFSLFDRVAGMTGTCISARDEIWEVYGLACASVPTHRPVIRKEPADRLFTSDHARMSAMAKTAKHLQAQGRPVLIGTKSIEESERLCRYLDWENLDYQLLNARQDAEEAAMIARAGETSRITVATNMAGRGTDIKCDEQAKEAGGLAVISCGRNDARRIDDQLAGRAGRQGEPGSAQFFLSLDDDLLKLYAGASLFRKKDSRGEIPVTGACARLIERAQKKLEAKNFEARCSVMRFDSVLSVQREALYKARRALLSGAPMEKSMRAALKGAASRIAQEDTPAGELYENWFIDKDTLEGASDMKSAIARACLGKLIRQQELLGEDAMRDLCRRLMLDACDRLWCEHLERMALLKDGIGLRAYAQLDPQKEYAKDGERLFREMCDQIGEETLAALCRIERFTIAENRSAV